MGSERIAPALRRQVSERAKYCCEYCKSQARFAMQALSVDHIEPRSRRGKTSLSNLAFACQGCNNHKYKRTQARDPLTEQMVPLFHPRRHRWRDHFTWNADSTLIIGL